MKFKFVIGLALLTLGMWPTLAQQGGLHTVSFDGIRFSYDAAFANSLNIRVDAGDPVASAGPGFSDAARVAFQLYNQPNPELSGQPFPANIRVYRLADLAQYDFMQAVVDDLRTLLDQRPDLATYYGQDTRLPYLPILTHGQVIRSRAQYIETAALRGVAYITAVQAAAEPFVNTSFFYTVQGISTDGQYYVSADLALNVAVFPSQFPADFNMETFIAGLGDYLNQSVTQLNSATPGDFSPSLEMLDGLVQSMTFETVSVAPSSPATVTPVSDSSLGGLAGSWRLVSYGAVDAPIPVLESAPITAVFSAEGIQGSAGCNTYFGTFGFADQTLTMSPLASTEKACDGVGVIEQEAAYLSALQGAAGYQVSNEQLVIAYEGGALTFAADTSAIEPTVIPDTGDSSLGGLAGSWTLVSYGSGQAVLPGYPITADFTAQGVSGSAGCNSYSGIFTYSNGTVTIGELVTTLLACAEANAMEQEAAYLAALQTTGSYQVNAGQLIIGYEGGALVFDRVE